MEIGRLGPEGVMQRMEEIRNRIREAFPEMAPPIQSGQSGRPAPLQGQISGGGFAPFDPNANGVRISPDAADMRPLIEKAAKENGVDVALLDALVQAESNYAPNARSRAGALGLTQLMPDTAAALGVSNPFDPVQNLNGGAKYLSQLLSRFNGDASLALAAYNAGPNTVERYGKIPPYPETQNYVNKVLTLAAARRIAP